MVSELLDCLRSLDSSIDRYVDLFAEDGACEFPDLPTLGMADRFEGWKKIRPVLGVVYAHFRRFTVSNVGIHHLPDASGLFIEYHVEAVVAGRRNPMRKTMSAASSASAA